MKFSLELNKQESDLLESTAEQLGIKPEELARAALLEVLNRDDDFQQAAKHVVEKNLELYKRLS
jgi:hypothetical protein